jgi:hypothetical protein
MSAEDVAFAAGGFVHSLRMRSANFCATSLKPALLG